VLVEPRICYVQFVSCIDHATAYFLLDKLYDEDYRGVALHDLIS